MGKKKEVMVSAVEKKRQISISIADELLGMVDSAAGTLAQQTNLTVSRSDFICSVLREKLGG